MFLLELMEDNHVCYAVMLLLGWRFFHTPAGHAFLADLLAHANYYAAQVLVHIPFL